MEIPPAHAPTTSSAISPPAARCRPTGDFISWILTSRWVTWWTSSNSRPSPGLHSNAEIKNSYGNRSRKTSRNVDSDFVGSRRTEVSFVRTQWIPNHHQEEQV